MICWDRVDGQIIGVFTPRQIRWLRKHVGALLATAHDAVFPVGAHAWPAGTGEAGLDVLARMLGDAAVVLSTLPGTGGVVVLSRDSQIWAWIWTLSECRSHLAFRLGLTGQTAQATTPPRSGGDRRIDRTFSTVADWLTNVVGDLISVAELAYPTVDGIV